MVQVNSFKKLLSVSAGLAVITFCSMQSAAANWTVNVNDVIKLYDGPGNVNAGEFIVKTNQNGDNWATERFRTFCVQTNEYLTLGEPLKIVGISSQSWAGGQHLMAATSALYREYLRGYELAGTTANAVISFLGTTYKFNATSDSPTSDAGLLQQAIWKYQGQSSYAGVTNKFTLAIDALAATLGWGAGALDPSTGLKAVDLTSSQGLALYGGVQVLNLKRGTNYATLAQDQLYYDGPNNLTEVPEPTSLALFGFGFVGAAWNRRRQNRLSQVA